MFNTTPRKPLCHSPAGVFRPALAAFAALLLLGGRTDAAHVSWSPPAPCQQDEIRIVVDYATQGGVLHWGVNGEQRLWEAALPKNRPPGSEQREAATRTRFTGPDENGRCEVVLGPFRDPEQVVRSLHFAIEWDDGTWNNNNGQDYRIDLCSRRVTFDPASPTYRDPIRVRVEDAGAGGVLHWGVNESRPGRWVTAHEVYRPAGTEPYGAVNAVETPLPPADANGVSELVLGPFDRPEQVVTSLHAAVRWGEHWDANLGSNFNVAVDSSPEDTPYLTLQGLVDGATVHEDVSLNVLQDAGGTAPVPVELWLNQKLLRTLPAGETVVRLASSDLAYGAHRLVALARVGERTERVHLDFQYFPRVEERPAPVGLRLGAVETPQGKVRFALHAPGKQAVAVIGDFNDWAPEAHLLYRAADGIWWRELDLPSGRHRYQYLVDGHLRIADPYARDVESKNEQGEETWNPDYAMAVLDLGAVPYVWKDHGYRRPPLDDLIIYELYVDDFAPGAGFQGVIDRLDYIRDLGVTAIELLPVNEFATTHSWGYNPAFHFAVESNYGHANDFKRLVDEAHQRGLAVIFDAVFNHMDSMSPLYRLFGENYDASPWFHLFEGDNWGFPDLDQTSPALQQYFADVLGFWLREFRVDGFRYDATRWVGWSGEKDWGASWFAYAGKLQDPDSYHIAEHLPPDPQLMVQTHMDSNWDSEFRWRIREMLTQGRLDARAFEQVVDSAASGYEKPSDRMIYLESHDEERVMRDLRQAGFNEEDAVRRVKAGHMLLLTSPGLVMLYSGEEWGEATDKVVGLNPLHWENLDHPPFASIRENLVNLIALRRSHPALRSGPVRMLHQDEARGVAAYVREADNRAVLVAVNFSRDPQTVQAPAGPGWSWRDFGGDDTAAAEPDGTAIHLPAGSARVRLGERTAP